MADFSENPRGGYFEARWRPKMATENAVLAILGGVFGKYPPLESSLAIPDQDQEFSLPIIITMSYLKKSAAIIFFAFWTALSVICVAGK